MPATLALLAVCVAAARAQAADARFEFDIAEQPVDTALLAFAQQAGVSILFPRDQFQGIRGNRLVGEFSLEDGLKRLLLSTAVEASLEGDADNPRVVVRARPAAPPPAADSVSAARPAAPQTEPRRRSGATRRAARRTDDTLSAVAASSTLYPQNEARAALEEIVVTGTRIRRDDFGNRQPTTVIGAETLATLGAVNVGDAFASLPSNLGAYTPTAKPGGNESVPFNVFNGANLANLRGMNPAYGSRTLLLVDSRRHVPTNQGDGVDLNMIPTILTERIEIVTGGASASYGSGALAGVVNVLLDRDFEGARAEVGAARTDHGDGDDLRYAFAWGAPVVDSGHLVVGFEGQRLDPIENCIATRAWCARNARVEVNRDYASNADPHYVYRENVRQDVGTTGVFPRLDLALDASGTAVQAFRTSGPYGVGGDGQPVWLDTTLRSSVEREVGYALYRQSLGDDLTLTIDASAAAVNAYSPQDSIDANNRRLRPDNYYLNRLATNPCASTAPADCVINKDFSSQVDAANDTQTDLTRVAVGIGGAFGTRWSYDAYYQYGKSETLQAVYETRHAQRFDMALDAVDDGTGSPVCRVTRDGFFAVYGAATTVDPRLADGCVPINIFGLDNITPAAYDYTHGRILEHTDVEQDMIELVASGDLFGGLRAGPIRAALGASWRDESIENPADSTQPDHIRIDYNSQFGESFAGTVEVWELFGELDVPVTPRFDVQLAARGSDYENTAGAGTGVEGRAFEYDISAWKVNGFLAASDAVKLRFSRSRDVRAPNFRELYYRKIFASGSAGGFCSNPWTGVSNLGFLTFTGDPCILDLRGGLGLTPEKADTTTVGIVLTPTARSFRIAVDYFEIEVEDAITPANLAFTLDGCALARDPYFCEQISGTLLDPNDPLGGFADIFAVTPVAMNLSSYTSRGLDISADWVRDFDFGTLSTRVLASRMIEQLVQPSAASPLLRDVSGVTGRHYSGFDWQPAADWAAQWTGTFSRGPFRVTAQARYVSDGRKDYDRTGPQEAGFDPDQPNSIDDNRMPSYAVLALAGSYSFERRGTRIDLFGAIHNMLDRDPPLSGLGIAGTNPVFYDTVGRTYRVGVSARF